MPGKDWILGPDEEFDAQYKKYCQVVSKNTSGATPVWPHIPAARVTELLDGYADWYTALSKLSGAHTSGDVQAKNEARAEAEEILRDFNRSFVLYAREVTDAQRRDVGCPVHDKHPSPVHKPWAECEADIAYPGRHLLELVHIRALLGTLSDEEAKAEFGVRIFWGILGTDLSAVPTEGKELPHSTFTHRKRFRFDFDGESGKTVYFCLRYENEKGGKEGEGPFGPIFSAIIP
jgi:hypothetical protein